MGKRAPVCTDEDLDMAADYLYRYESGDPEDNVDGVHRVADMLRRLLEARWARNGSRRAKKQIAKRKT